SRGIGRAIAVALAENGADIAIGFLESHRNDAEQVAQKIRDYGRQVLLCPGDVADNKSVEESLNKIMTQFGAIDITVANAAHSDRDWFYEADLAKVHRTVDVTMWGAFHVFRAAAQQMIGRKKGGVLIGISSPMAFVPIAKSMPYNMAKAALDQM